MWGLKQPEGRCRITRPFSAAHFAIAAVAVLAIVVLAGLVEATLGFGNVIVIFLLVPVVVRAYMVKRTALMVAATGVTVQGRHTPWPDVGELVVIGPTGANTVAVGLRRRSGSRGNYQRRSGLEPESPPFVAHGTVPRAKYNRGELRAAFERFAPRAAVLSGWGFDELDQPGDDGGSAPSPVGISDAATAAVATGGSPSTRAETDAPVAQAATSRGGPLGATDTPAPSRSRSHSTAAARRWRAMRDDGRVLWLLLVLAIVGSVVGVRWFLRPDAVDADFVGVYPQAFFVPGESVRVPEDVGLLRGPRFNLAIERVASVGSLEKQDSHRDRPDSDQLPSRFRAADGHELLVAYLPYGPNLRPDWADDESEPEVSIVVGDDRRWLDDLPEAGEIIVASVPDGADALLEVTAEGMAQSISLRTGEREQAIDGFYTEAAQQLDYEYAWTGRFALDALLTEPDDETVQLSITSVSREPWHYDLGYAADGRSWLSADAQIVGIVRRQPITGSFDASATFMLVDERGNEIGAMPEDLTAASGDQDVVFDVADTFTSGTLHVRPGAGFRCSRCAWVTPPPDDSVAIELTERPAR